jgi:hypothetical protein
MKKLITVQFNYLRNEAHYEFMIVFRTLGQRFPAVLTLLATLFTKFLDLLQTEEQLVDAMRKSDYTQQIAEADARVDRDICGIREAIASGCHHYDPNIVEAAISLRNRLKVFGDIAKKSYEEETAAVNLLLIDLRGDYASKVDALDIRHWVDELRDAEDAFEQLLDLRNTERAQKPQGHIAEIRKEINEVYHQMCSRIEAAAILQNVTGLDEFIAELNMEITYFNDHSHRHSKKDIATANVDNIPVQIFAGKPVIVIPVVQYESQELVFAKDFAVTYKHNDTVGTADLIIHGKGKYNGRKIVTFTIKDEEIEKV